MGGRKTADVAHRLAPPETPWDSAKAESQEYRLYVAGRIFALMPWVRLKDRSLREPFPLLAALPPSERHSLAPSLARSPGLIRSLLRPEPELRLSLAEARLDPWCSRWASRH